jgi:hypothetical protein
MVDLALKDWVLIEPYPTPVSWLHCFHGIDTVRAMTLATELVSDPGIFDTCG